MDPGESRAAARMAEFAARCVAPRRDALAAPGPFPRDLWAALGEAGLLGSAVPERFGGLGGSERDLILAGAALARHGGNLGLAGSWLGHCLVGRFFLERFAPPALQARWLPRVADGTATLAVAISEPGAGAHPKHLAGTATRVAEGWRLHGEKAYVTNGPIAAAFVVLAVSAVESGRKRFSAFLVPRETAGLALVPGREVDFFRPSPHCGLRLDGCTVPRDAMIGAEGDAFETMSIPFRDYEDALGTGKLVGAVRHLIDRGAAVATGLAADARAAAGAELGALAGLAAALYEVALALPAALARGMVDAPLIGFRLTVQAAATRLEALPERLGFAWSASEAALLRDIGKSLDIAKAPRLIKQTRLGLSLVEHAPS